VSETLVVLMRVVSGVALVSDLALRTCFGRMSRRDRRSVRDRLSAPFTVLDGLMLLAGAAYYVGLLLFVVWPGLFAFARLPTSVAAFAAGVVVLAAGLTFLLRSHVALGAAFGFGLEPVEGQPLVTDGPYRRVRHPMYAGAMLMTVGAALVTVNLFFAGAAVLMVAVMNVRARREDRVLEAALGDAWRQYAATRGRFFPWKLC